MTNQLLELQPSIAGHELSPADNLQAAFTENDFPEDIMHYTQELEGDQKVLWDHVQQQAEELGVENSDEFGTAYELVKIMNGYHQPLGDHTMRVAMGAVDSARKIGVDPGEALISGLLHDAGKLKVDYGVLSKTTRYDQADIDAMNWHSAYGYFLIKSLGFSEDLVSAIGNHHNNREGSGVGIGDSYLTGNSAKKLRDALTIADFTDSRLNRNDGFQSEGSATDAVHRHASHVLGSDIYVDCSEREVADVVQGQIAVQSALHNLTLKT